MTDFDHLQDYVRTGSNQAFAAIMAQHLGWVFGAALRQTNSVPLAEEIAQAVFLDLARQAPKLRAGTQLGSWLCVVTRRTAIDFLRRESRRRQREQTAFALSAMNADDRAWSRAEPVIDEALSALGEADRRAVLLRFFEQRSLEEIGTALGVSEDAAQKRVGRALDRLRLFLQRRGITTTAAALGAGLTASGQVVAPAGLAPAIATALPTVAALGATASSGFLSTLAMAATNKALLATAATLAFGTLVVGAFSIRAQRDELAQLRAELHGVRPGTAQDATPAADAPQQAAAADSLDARLEELAERVALLKRMLAASPDQQAPELAVLTEKDWLDVASSHEPRTASEFRRCFSALRETAKHRVFDGIAQKLREYIQSHQGGIPASLTELAPLLEDPLQKQLLARLEFVNRGNVRDLARDAVILREIPATVIDAEYDRTAGIGWRHFTWLPNSKLNRRPSPEERRLNEAAEFASVAFARAHGGRKPANMEEILPYFRDPNDAADFKYAFEQLKGAQPK